MPKKTKLCNLCQLSFGGFFDQPHHNLVRVYCQLTLVLELKFGVESPNGRLRVDGGDTIKKPCVYFNLINSIHEILSILIRVRKINYNTANYFNKVKFIDLHQKLTFPMVLAHSASDRYQGLLLLFKTWPQCAPLQVELNYLLRRNLLTIYDSGGFCSVFSSSF